ncbi:MAG: hypothetical protein WBC92_08190 [Terracidiphilus sp.]
MFARRFTNGRWEAWEHMCNEEEVDGVVDSAQAKTWDRVLSGPPSYADYLNSVRYVFDVVRGEANNPRDGDLQVYGVCVDGVVTGVYEELRGHFRLAQQAA